MRIPTFAAALLILVAAFSAGCSKSHSNCTRCGRDAASDAAGDASRDADDDGGDTPAGRCRSGSDCTGDDEYCHTDDTPGMCGIACNAVRDCEPDEPTSCPDADTVCVEYIGDCCFNGERSSQCTPKCTEGSCEADQVCTAAGRCEAKSCADDYACPPDFTCEPATADALNHGCVRNTCTLDGTCDGGHCVQGHCFRDLGVCTVFLPVP